ncbi:hypothetical protein RchiOBHm_Chr2g0109511 [Rosa chinensis]|uniref:26S proteasome non-ATPase regulatory subunit 1/RPN2 N-terminal domain-containing protein n=1 Tax=Rosa chinensis TaxID=74649 RepID=A0A2P6RPH4_ROSCH|nr:hypothetical protein RchiOBHm_Chr2g0109511 [Rosa chinensis]
MADVFRHPQGFYYFGKLNDSLSYALGAGSLFDAAESNAEAANVDPRLEAIVERMLNKCIIDGKYQQAMEKAIECQRLDKIEEVIITSDCVRGTIVSMSLIGMLISENTDMR